MATHAPDTGSVADSTSSPSEGFAKGRTRTPEPLKAAVEEEKDDNIKLPAGVKLTGNKDVDDDIIAFYKAKAELMARSKGSQ